MKISLPGLICLTGRTEGTKQISAQTYSALSIMFGKYLHHFKVAEMMQLAYLLLERTPSATVIQHVL